MTQDQALVILKTGASVFLTGEAGSGKTHTINRYTEYLREQKIDFAVTASTGIAATHIGGMTIHSWSGIGIASELSEDDLKHLGENSFVAKRIKKAKVLIIDEISMLDGNVLSLVERVCRKVRKATLPFGGLQVILVGDFFQLPPVASQGRPVQFAFDSEAWQSLSPTVCYLSEQYRQDDSRFLEVLTAIRKSACDEDHFETIRERLVTKEELPDDTTRLFPKNVDVDAINATELKRLPGKQRSFVMARRGPEVLTDALKRGCLSPEALELKEGAAVMFTKNNPSEGFVNGTLGVVVGFEEGRKYPIVETKSGKRITAEPMEWTIAEGDEVVAKVTQLPLRLAWAMTIHKSQGVSLDAAVIDLSQAFEYGQGYVALSRVRSLSGVHLLGMNQRALEVHPEVSVKDEEFRNLSLHAEARYEAMPKERLAELFRNFIIISGGTEKKGADPVAPKAYQKWTEAEDMELIRLYRTKTPVKSLMAVFGRKRGAISSRIKKLGLGEERKA
ncbi:MAG: PIF1 family DEAD/DEAH box helicase [Patescibacteria group bacterium]